MNYKQVEDGEEDANDDGIDDGDQGVYQCDGWPYTHVLSGVQPLFLDSVDANDIGEDEASADLEKDVVNRKFCVFYKQFSC
jgi:hypothetical protein